MNNGTTFAQHVWGVAVLGYMSDCPEMGIALEAIEARGYRPLLASEMVRVAKHVPLVLGVGRTAADLEFMRRCMTCIVTHDEGEEPDPALVAEAEKRGWYIAPANRPNGTGVAWGIQLAIEAGCYFQ